MFKQFKITKDKYGLKTALYYHIPLLFTFKWSYWIGSYVGICVAPFILVKSYDNVKIVRHEIIHFWQQLAFTLPLFLIIYGINYSYLRLIKKMNNNQAYRNSIFEAYAYKHDDNIDEVSKLADILDRKGL